jgi:F420H(2)-dependent quinone reductase
MGLLTPLAIRIGALSWLPKLLPRVVWTDKLLQRLTRGRITILDLAGLPNLMLTVVGRGSGIPRSTPLLCVPYGESFLVAGSYFGGPRQPVSVTGEARDVAWQHMLKTWPNFAKYEERTSREIKVFELTRS